ncbi:hypothetical protein PSTT_02656 [Puccinia striiformis]|uniref:Yeast cell wall synthesis Kre9/Knh1-like N-terminal domain-containing protein n=1 Tax=Puccinia striiformis TaxID=27350 RepID=A0A2S4VZB0_9BASI|nr:hypothetical protein PSTT_02656 [Puccinia striiformis]
MWPLRSVVLRSLLITIMISSNVLACLIAIFLNGILALNVTSPTGTSQWDRQLTDQPSHGPPISLQATNTLTWTSVATDPKTFDVVLTNNDPACAPTGFTQAIKQNVTTTDGKFDISGVSSVKACGGYQINLVAPSTPDNSANNTGILAQSAPFNVTATPGLLAGALSTANGLIANATSAINSTLHNSTISASAKNTTSNHTTPFTGAPISNSSAPAGSDSFAPTLKISLQNVIACALLPVTFMLL